MINTNIELSGLENLPGWKVATDKELKLALIRSLTKTIRWLKTHVLREVSRQLKIPQILLRPRVVVSRADKNDIEASLWFGTYRITLLNAAGGRARQVSTGVRVKGKTINHAFIATMKSGHKGIYMRRGKGRLPVNEQMIGIGKTVEEKIKKLVAGPLQRRFEKIFEHEIDFVTGAL